MFGKLGLLQLYPGWWHLCLPHLEPDWVSAFELLCSYPISDLTTPTVLHGSPLAGVLTTTRCQNTILCGTLSQPGTFLQLPPGILTVCLWDCETQTPRIDSLCLFPHPWAPSVQEQPCYPPRHISQMLFPPLLFFPLHPTWSPSSAHPPAPLSLVAIEARR